MSTEDADYLLARAEEELKSAEQATHPEAVKVHTAMANHYLDRVYGPDDDEPDASDIDAGESNGRKEIEG